MLASLFKSVFGYDGTINLLCRVKYTEQILHKHTYYKLQPNPQAI